MNVKFSALLGLILVATAALGQTYTGSTYRSRVADSTTVIVPNGYGGFFYNAQKGELRLKDATGWFNPRSAGSGNPFSDGTPLVKNASDATKRIAFGASGISTGTTRTYAGPNFNGNLMVTGGTNVLSGATNFSGSTQLRFGAPTALNSFEVTADLNIIRSSDDANRGYFGVQDGISVLSTLYNNTDSVEFRLDPDNYNGYRFAWNDRYSHHNFSGLTAGLGNIRTYNYPNKSGTIALLGDVLKRNDSTVVGQAGYGIESENPLNNATLIIVKDSTNAAAGFAAVDQDPSVAVKDSVAVGVVTELFDDGLGNKIKGRVARLFNRRGTTGEESTVYASGGAAGLTSTDGSNNAVITVNSSGFSMYYNQSGVGVNLSNDVSGLKITDGRVTKVGLQYASDYSASFTTESLITKRYADSKVATTVTDGVTTSAPNQNAVYDFVKAEVAAGDVTYGAGKKVRIYTRALNEILSSTSGSMGAAVLSSEIANGEAVTVRVQWTAKDDNTNTGAGGVFTTTWTKAGGTLVKSYDSNFGNGSNTGDALVLSSSDVGGDITISIGTGTTGGNFSASAIAEVVIRKP